MPWNANYRENFRFTLTKASSVVIVLSQLDGRYFRGLEGQYRFTLNFRLHSIEDLDDGDAYVARSHGKACMKRSVSVDLPELPEGTYCVFVKVSAVRISDFSSVEKIVEEVCRDKENNEKFSQVGMSYNMAHAKDAGLMEAQMRMRVKEEWKKRKAREERHMRRSRKIAERRQQQSPRLATEMKMPAAAPKTGGIRTPSVSLKAETIITKPGTTPSSSHILPLQRYQTVSDHSSSQSRANTRASIHTTDTQHATNPSTSRSSTPQMPLREDSDTSLPLSMSGDSSDDSSSDSDYQRYKLRVLSYDHPPPGDADNEVEPWNAVCMVGLRVYSKDAELRIEAIMPGRGQRTGLDIDDNCASMIAPTVTDEEMGMEMPVRLRRMMTL